MPSVNFSVDSPLSAESAPSRGSWWGDGGVVFWLLIGACLAPIWTVRYFPSQDGSEHLYNALILRFYDASWAGVFRKYLYLNTQPMPSLLGHWMLAGLMYVVRPNVAEKLLLSLYIVMLPLSVRYAVRSIERGNGFLAFMSFPLIYNMMFHKGLYSFCLSLPVFFFFVGYWLRRRGQFDWKSALLLLVLSLLLYFAHVVSLAEAYATVGVAAGVRMAWDLVARRRGGAARPPLGKMLWSSAALPLLALAPTLVLAGCFFLSQDPSPEGKSGKLRDLLRDLAGLSCLVSYQSSEWIFAGCVAVLFLGLGALGIWRLVRQPQEGRSDLLLCVGAAVLFYLVTPSSAGGGALITPRLQLYCYFLLLLFLAGTPFPRWIRLAAPVAAVLLCLCMLLTYSVQYRKLNVYLADYMSCAARLTNHSTLLPICISENGYLADGKSLCLHKGVHIFLHFSTRLGIEKRVVVLKNYETAKNYFPTLFWPEVTVDGRVGKFGQGLLRYHRRTNSQGRIDYVLVWNMREPDGTKLLSPAQADLDEAYDLIYTTPLGFGKLYRRGDLTDR